MCAAAADHGRTEIRLVNDCARGLSVRFGCLFPNLSVVQTRQPLPLINGSRQVRHFSRFSNMVVPLLPVNKLSCVLLFHRAQGSVT